MSTLIDPIDIVVEPPTDWRPPGWRDGKDDPHAPDSGHVPENTEESYQQYMDAGYFTAGGKLTEAGRNKKDASTAEDVAWNRKALRDAWNTHAKVWELGALLVGCDFRVDPFHNAGARALPGLQRTLNGLTPETDGLACDPETFFPTNWRGALAKGQAAAAVNGPHSVVEKWLRCCRAYGQEEIVAAFVPDNGDAWFQQIGMTAQLVVRLGRVPCSPPPGINKSSPRGASALLVWIPEPLIKSMPAHTRDVLKGRPFRTGLWTRARKGVQCAYVQPGDTKRKGVREVDLGLLG